MKCESRGDEIKSTTVENRKYNPDITNKKKQLLEADIAPAVAFAIVHVEKCKVDQPSMKAEIDAAFSLWKQRNQKHITAAESRADFKEIKNKFRALFNEKGSLPVSDCQLLIQRAKSPKSDIDVE